MLKKLIFLLPLLLLSCIENDIPYPTVELYITNIEGEGFTMNTPNSSDRTILLTLDETTNIDEVNITEVSYSPQVDFTLSLDMTASPISLRMPQSVTISLYQNYTWTISAEQSIERYFKVQGQIGSEVIDTDTKSITAYVSESTDLSAVVVTALKLGPDQITTYDVEIADLTAFSSYRAVNISYHSTTERWKLYVLTTDVKVSVTQADTRAKYIEVTAAGDTESGSAGFRYRLSGQEEWTEVDSELITLGEGVFSTKISALDPETTYEYLAYIGEDESEVFSTTTESLLPLPDAGFEDWTAPTSSNKSYYPFAEGGEEYWATGNTGATTLGDKYNLTTPSEDTPSSSTGLYSASLESKNVMKFAAGSIFTGTFVKIAGTNGIIGLGRPFTSRPTSLKGWVKHTCGTVDMVGSDAPGIVIGDKDQGSIYIALGTWDAATYGVSEQETVSLGTSEIPMIIDTRDSATFFNKDGADVVAYGELIITESIGEWSEFEIILDYKTLETLPTHIIIVCSSSRYGDYFVGSTSSHMYVDDFELGWE